MVDSGWKKHSSSTSSSSRVFFSVAANYCLLPLECCMLSSLSSLLVFVCFSSFLFRRSAVPLCPYVNYVPLAATHTMPCHITAFFCPCAWACVCRLALTHTHGTRFWLISFQIRLAAWASAEDLYIFGCCCRYSFSVLFVVTANCISPRLHFSPSFSSSLVFFLFPSAFSCWIDSKERRRTPRSSVALFNGRHEIGQR